MATKTHTDPMTGEITELLDDNGWEIPDPKPVALPSGFKKPERLEDTVRRLVRSETWRRDMEAAGDETFEDSEDFDVDEDFDPNTPFETFFDPALGREITPMEFKQHEETYKKRYIKAQQEYYAQIDAENTIAENLARSRARTKAGSDDRQPPPGGSQLKDAS